MLKGLFCSACDSESIVYNGNNKDGSKRFLCKICGSHRPPNGDIISENVRLAKKSQKFQDSNRIERKSFREYARIENALESYNKELIKVVKKHSSKTVVKDHKENSKNVLIVQLTDLHLNELISVKNNKYDFNVASKRLKKFATKIKLYAKVNEVKKILVFCLGDLLNSDRRLDELLNMATNRANASYFAFYLLEQFILDLNKIANVDVFSVTGNESRVKDEHSFSDILATDNYDHTIHQMLSIAFRGKKGVQIINGSPKEQIVNIFGRDYLLLHGETIGNDTQKKLTQIIGKHSLQGYDIVHAFFGHLHSSYISDWFSRGSSLAGSNSYNENALHLLGRACQNLHLLNTDGSMDSIKVDLQDAVKGYDISDIEETYHIKSADKLKNSEIIFKVTI